MTESAPAPDRRSTGDSAAATGKAPRPAPAGRRRRVVPAVAGGLLGLVAVVYAVAYLFVGDTLPVRAEVAGVGVGGLSREEATDKLRRELQPRENTAIPVVVDGANDRVRPDEAGLTVDHARSIDLAGGRRSLDPRRLARALTGGGPSEVVVAVDQERLEAAVEDLARRVDREPVNGSVSYDGTKVRLGQSRVGIVVQQPAAAVALVERFPSGGDPVTLPAQLVQPDVDDADTERTADEVARPAVAAPVKVRVGSSTISITPAMIAKSLSFEARDGDLRPDLDAALLRRFAEPALRDAGLTQPRDATVRLAGNRPTVVPSVDGTTVTAANLRQAVEPALTRTGTRRAARVPVTAAAAEFSTADARALGITEVTGRFTTRFPYLAYRNVNIGRAAELVDGTLLKPGEVFSLNRVVGERTRANGFTEGYIISGGKFRKELGGGVSQVATTTFNAMFFAGLKDVEHQPHTLYIDRYPPGREATVAWPNLDLKFQNDTRHGVLVQAEVVKAAPGRQGSITVTMWSTKTYDKIEATTPVRTRVTTGRDLTDDSPDCEPQEPATGFDVSYNRLFYRDGDVVKRQRFSWRYGPTDRIRCG